MNDRRTEYEQEIVDYLVARLERRRIQKELRRPNITELPRSRILDWWLFEGRRYPGYTQGLAYVWPRVIREVRRLLASHSPSRRELEMPDGEVDWVATALATGMAGSPRYICRTSRIGLGDDEYAALTGWQGWIAVRWNSYCAALGAPDGAWNNDLPWLSQRNEIPGIARLRRWAHTARRSRWPLMRHVVAESLRAVLEPQTLEHLPLPQDDATLFELLCLVRVLSQLDPEAGCVRWLDLELGHNSIETERMKAFFQHAVDTDIALRSVVFDGGLGHSVVRHNIRLPSRIDALIVPRQALSGYSALLLEAKSGDQGYEAALFQLMCYREALRERFPGPVVVWGIVENVVEADWISRAVEAIRTYSASNPGSDLWLFSSADDIGAALHTLGLAISGRGAEAILSTA